MCIICNCGLKAGDAYLMADAGAKRTMREAADAMLACAKSAKTPEQAKQYDATYKAMVRLIREWNRLEQTREVHDAPVS